MSGGRGKVHPQTVEIIAAYRNGSSRREIVQEFGVTLGWLGGILARNNVLLSEVERLERQRNGCMKGRAIIKEGQIRPGVQLRPVPEGFADLAPTMLKFELIKHYRTSETVLARWLEETGVKSRAPSWKRPMPADFAEVGPTMSKTQLCRHYSVNNEAVNRWLLEAGVTAAKAMPGNYTNHPRPVVRVRSMITPYEHQAEATPYDDALFVLRKANPVYRCNDRGGFDPKGKFFRIGASCHIMTGDELLARAERVRERESDRSIAA